MKNQTIKQYKLRVNTQYPKLIDFAETTLREHWGSGADPLKLIGLAEEMGLYNLAQEFKTELIDEKETQADIAAYHEPTLKTIFNH